VSSLFSFSSGQKDHLILVVVAATTTIFTFRNNTSEQYQRNTDIIPKLFDIVPKVYFAGFSSFSSYQKDNLISCAHFAHLICNVVWAGSQRPTPKSMGKNGPLILLRNNTEKSRWYCSEYSSAYCSEYSSDNVPRPDKLVIFCRISALFCNNTCFLSNFML